MEKSNLYRCNLCGAVVRRESNKAWIKSMCDTTGKDSRLMKLTLNQKLIDKLCKEFLPNQFDLSTFEKSDRIMLEMAFSQGANVMMNILTN